MLLILFGLPGAGKTFVGTILKKDYNFFFYDGDSALPTDMKKVLMKKQVVSMEMRNRFFEKLIHQIYTLEQKEKNLVIAQTFIKEEYRQQLMHRFPNAKFLLVTTKEIIRKKRLSSRKIFPLETAYAQAMVENFDFPKIAYTTIINDVDGKETITAQLDIILQQ